MVAAYLITAAAAGFVGGLAAAHTFDRRRRRADVDVPVEFRYDPTELARIDELALARSICPHPAEKAIS
jgi:hypothetical protein